MSPIWSRDPRALWRRSGQRVIVLCGYDRQPFVLAGTGLVLWALLEDPIEQEELVAELALAYGTDAAIVEAQVLPFLEELVAAEAVRAW